MKNNVDYDSGYWIGLKNGKKRINGKLFDRLPPEHLIKSIRYNEWKNGYKDGLLDRKCKITIVQWRNPDGKLQSKIFKGHIPDNRRSDFVSRVKTSVDFSFFDCSSEKPIKEITLGY